MPIIVGLIVQITGSYFLAMMFFAGAGVALLICSSLIDYSRKLRNTAHGNGRDGRAPIPAPTF